MPQNIWTWMVIASWIRSSLNFQTILTPVPIAFYPSNVQESQSSVLFVPINRSKTFYLLVWLRQSCLVARELDTLTHFVDQEHRPNSNWTSLILSVLFNIHSHLNLNWFILFWLFFDLVNRHVLFTESKPAKPQ